MIFANIPDGTALFLDANTLVYHFAPDPQFGPACHQLIDRIERQEIFAFTSTHVLSDVAHRLMTLEAITRFNWQVAGIAQRLKRHPGQIQQLTSFRTAVERTLQSQIQVLALSSALVLRAADLGQ